VAEDDEYVYKVELLINVREKEEDGMEYLTHKLLLFDYEEKASGKGMA
jgi:alanine dehydrogenase